MRFRGEFQLPSFDLKGYREALDRYFSKEIVDAARTFLNAATANIPVWSGASLGTFRPLAREAGYPLLIAPVARSFNSSPRPQSIGEIVRDKTKGIYSFEYSSDLRHLVFNEFNNANISPDSTLFGRLLTPGPYGAMAKGQRAIRRSMLKRPLPRLTKFISIEKVSF